jgi:hypothetical protein
MTFAHLMGTPVEESVLTLAPAGAAILTGVVVVARSKLAGIAGWLSVARNRAGRSSTSKRTAPYRSPRSPRSPEANVASGARA